MAEFFTTKSVPTCQSTPKPGSHLLVQPQGTDGGGPSSGEKAVSFVSFVSLDDDDDDGGGDGHVMSSEDSGIMLDISSITERSDSHVCKKPKLGDPQTSCSSLPGSKVDELGRRAQELVERINQSRDEDQEIICSFQDQLLSKVGEVCQQVKEQLFSSYEEQSQGMEEQLQELSRVLERSSQLSCELQDVSNTLSVINTGLLQTPGP
ncbi:unnamed protein product [Merluccius merluccius]